MLENVVNGTKKALAGIVLSVALASGCAKPYIPKTGEFSSESYALPGFGVSALVSTAISGGPIKTFSVSQNGKLLGVRTADYHWGNKKFGEAYFEFPRGASEVGAARMASCFYFKYHLNGSDFNESFFVSRIPYKVWLWRVDQLDYEGEWRKTDIPPNIKVFKIVTNRYGAEEYVPMVPKPARQ